MSLDDNGKFTDLYKDEYRSVGKMRTWIRFVQEVAIFVPKLLKKVSKGVGKSLNLATKLLNWQHWQ